jgi:hypothetical protein
LPSTMVKWGKKKQPAVMLTNSLSFEKLETVQTMAVAALSRTPRKATLKNSAASEAVGPPPLPHQPTHHHFGHNKKGATATAAAAAAAAAVSNRQPIERWIAWAALEAAESVCAEVTSIGEALERANGRLAQLPYTFLLPFRARPMARMDPGYSCLPLLPTLLPLLLPTLPASANRNAWRIVLLGAQVRKRRGRGGIGGVSSQHAEDTGRVRRRNACRGPWLGL